MYLHSLIHIEQSIAPLYENYSEAIPTLARSNKAARTNSLICRHRHSYKKSSKSDTPPHCIHNLLDGLLGVYIEAKTSSH